MLMAGAKKPSDSLLSLLLVNAIYTEYFQKVSARTKGDMKDNKAQ